MSDTRATFTTFEESTREEWAEIMRQIPATQAMAAHNVVDQLRMLDRDHGGFPVSRLEHSLQTATRAEQDGRDEEYVLCALLHDIGDTLAPFNHPSIAAGIVKPFVSEAHHWMVEHHGIFQGYYFWHHIGIDRNTRDRYRDSPYYDFTEEFCAKYDQVAFDPDFVSAPARALRADHQAVHGAERVRRLVPRLHGRVMRTAPLSARRLGALVAIGAVLLLGAGAVGGGIAKRRSLFAFDGVVWGRDTVVVRVDEGSGAVAAGIALAVVTAMVAVAFGVWVLIRRTLQPTPEARTRWLAALGACVVLGIGGLVAGWASTTTDDGVTASSVATYLVNEGGAVGADLPTGYVPSPRVSGTPPGGAAGARRVHGRRHGVLGGDHRPDAAGGRCADRADAALRLTALRARRGRRP